MELSTEDVPASDARDEEFGAVLGGGVDQAGGAGVGGVVCCTVRMDVVEVSAVGHERRGGVAWTE